ncbi:PKHB1 protein, partial [Dromaius novaehollandiae]|nr:PKHB1 protein [Dromaius novaehollandiae]
MALVKSGWLWRQSSILRRWKRNWFVLYLDGGLVYYHDESQRDMEGRIHVRHGCREVRAGRECRAPQPPEGKSRDCLLALVLRDGSATTLCAESEDDAVAWKVAVLEARATPVRLPAACRRPAPPNPPTRCSAGQGWVWERPPPHLPACRGGSRLAAAGAPRLVVREDPYRVSGDQMALGLLAGAATGAALGSFMWMPCWF